MRAPTPNCWLWKRVVAQNPNASEARLIAEYERRLQAIARAA